MKKYILFSFRGTRIKLRKDVFKNSLLSDSSLSKCLDDNFKHEMDGDCFYWDRNPNYIQHIIDLVLYKEESPIYYSWLQNVTIGDFEFNDCGSRLNSKSTVINGVWHEINFWGFERLRWYLMCALVNVNRFADLSIGISKSKVKDQLIVNKDALFMSFVLFIVDPANKKLSPNKDGVYFIQMNHFNKIQDKLLMFGLPKKIKI